jgi:hypothetical protein
VDVETKSRSNNAVYDKASSTICSFSVTIVSMKENKRFFTEFG